MQFYQFSIFLLVFLRKCFFKNVLLQSNLNLVKKQLFSPMRPKKCLRSHLSVQCVSILTNLVLVNSDAVCYVVRLFIEKLPKHPTYKNASRDDKQSTRRVL